jgi:hypothetical protein
MSPFRYFHGAYRFYTNIIYFYCPVIIKTHFPGLSSDRPFVISASSLPLFSYICSKAKNIRMGKKYIYLTSIVLSMLYLASSCTKKNPIVNNPPVSPQMVAMVAGTTWEASVLKASNANGVDTIAGIRGSDSSTILLLFPANQNAGDTLRVGSINTIEYIKSNITYDAINGSIIITSNANNLMTGTFTATVEDFNTSNKITITGGKFDARF